MNTRTRNALLVNAAWVLGSLGALVGLAWRSVDQLERSRAAVDAIELRIEHGQEQIDEQLALQAERELEDAAARRLSAWSTMTDSQSERVSELSRAAQRSGVQLTEMRSLEPSRAEGAPVLDCAHEITVTGTYFQIGRFLSAIQSAPGLVSIEDLVLAKQADQRDAGSEVTLSASMWVRWYAPDAEAAHMPGGR